LLGERPHHRGCVVAEDEHGRSARWVQNISKSSNEADGSSEGTGKHDIEVIEQHWIGGDESAFKERYVLDQSDLMSGSRWDMQRLVTMRWRYGYGRRCRYDVAAELRPFLMRLLGLS
jgi:hypothetical protein